MKTISAISICIVLAAVLFIGAYIAGRLHTSGEEPSPQQGYTLSRTHTLVALGQSAAISNGGRVTLGATNIDLPAEQSNYQRRFSLWLQSIKQ